MVRSVNGTTSSRAGADGALLDKGSLERLEIAERACNAHALGRRCGSPRLNPCGACDTCGTDPL